MSDESKFIGLGACPICKQLEARFTISKSNLVVCTCRQRGCGIQLFTRTGDGDEKTRAFIGTTSPEPAIAPAPSPSPAMRSTADPLPDADVLPPAPPKRKPSWGMGAFNG